MATKTLFVSFERDSETDNQIQFESFSVRVEIQNAYRIRAAMADINHCFVEIKLRDPTCDVSCISTNIQDGGLRNIGNQCHEIKQMLKFCNRLLYIVLESLSN